MNKTTKALMLAEEALVEYRDNQYIKAPRKALAAIREALAEPVKQEPVAWMYEAKFTKQVFLFRNNDILPKHIETPLYAAPVQPVKQEPVAEVILYQHRVGFGRTEERKDIKFLVDVEVGTKLYAAPVQPVSQEPVAFMFKVKRTTAASTVLDEFAAIDYFPQDGEEIVSKEPLSYAAPVQPVKQELNWGANKFMPHEQPVKQESVAWMDLHKELGQLRWMGGDEGWDNAIHAVRKRLEELYAAPVQPVQEPVAQNAKRYKYMMNPDFFQVFDQDSALPYRVGIQPKVDSGFQKPINQCIKGRGKTLNEAIDIALAAPVDAKAIRAEALEEAEEIAKTIGGSFAEEFLVAIRKLKNDQPT